MRIAPIKNLHISKSNGFFHTNRSSVVPETKKREYFSTPLFIYHQNAISFGKNQVKKYSYKPIASIIPQKALVGNYDDLDKFSKLFADKINSNLLVPNENDIENLIKRIQTKTKTDKKTIREVLYNLTFFSNYGSFKELSKLVTAYEIGNFGFNRDMLNDISVDSITNSAMNYLMVNKKFCKFGGVKSGLILDNLTLSTIENIKNSKNENDTKAYKTLINKIKNNQVVFINIKGWDIKTSNNGYKNANMLSGSGYLEDLAVEVVKKLKQENDDELYYSDFKERLYSLLKNDVDVKKLNIVDFHPQDDKKEKITNSDILLNLKPKTITKEYIKAMVESYMFYKSAPFHDKKIIQETLLKYLDEETVVFSIDSLALALRQMHTELENIKNQKKFLNSDIVYLLPESNKSFNLINAMYALVNNINPQDIAPLTFVSELNQDKIKVILDDISASGETQMVVIGEFKKNCNNKNNLIYSPVVLCKHAKYGLMLQNLQRQPDEYCYNTFVNDLSETKSDYEFITKYKVLTNKDKNRLFAFIQTGYEKLGLSVLFPYMIPDNCSDLASLMFKDLLYCENTNTNKPLKHYYAQAEDSISIELYKNIEKFAKELISSGKV